jgi:hypothetical protein
MNAEQSKKPVDLTPPPICLADVAAMENFVRLRQSQEAYLAWLKAGENKPDMDCYIYRKIR